MLFTVLIIQNFIKLELLKKLSERFVFQVTHLLVPPVILFLEALPQAVKVKQHDEHSSRAHTSVHTLSVITTILDFTATMYIACSCVTQPCQRGSTASYTGLHSVAHCGSKSIQITAEGSQHLIYIVPAKF